MGFYLRTLGELSLWADRDAAEPVMSDSKPLLILAVLALRPDYSARRDYLADLLWPDSDRTRGRRSLRQAIFNISRNASDDLLIDDEARSGLKLARERLEVDLLEFDEALEREDFAAAVRIHRGPFLSGVDHRAGPELESWIDSQQSRVRIGLEVAYTHLVSDALQAGDSERAVEHARAFADLNPLDERAQSSLVRALRAAGDEVGALQAYEAYRTLVERELGEDPARELEERADEIRDDVLGPAVEVLDSSAAAKAGEAPEVAERPPPRPAASPSRPARPAAGWWRLRDLMVRRTMVTTLVVLGLAALLVLGGFGLWNIWLARTPVAMPVRGVLALAGASAARSVIELRFDGAEIDWQASDLAADQLAAPDGRWMAGTVRTPEGWDLVVRGAGGAAPGSPGALPGSEYPIAWSPDSRLLLFDDERLDEMGRSYGHYLTVLDPTTGATRTLAQAITDEPIEAAWSPLGPEIAFAIGGAGRPETDDALGPGLYLIGIDGSGLRRLAEAGRDPAWSPDGRQLVFVSGSTDGGVESLHIVRAAQPKERRAVAARGSIATPRWVADRFVLAVRELAGRSDVWAFDLERRRWLRLSRRGDIVALVGLAPGVPGRRWVERVEIVPRRAQTSPGENLQFALRVVDAAETPRPRLAPDATWTTSDSTVVQPSGPARFEAVGEGVASLTASLRGWRGDTLVVRSISLGVIDAQAAFREDWSEGLQRTRWQPFGTPPPSVRTGRDVAYFFLSNGDEHFESGAVSSESFSLENGLTFELRGQLAFSGRPAQSFSMTLYPDDDLESTDWVSAAPLAGLTISGGGPAGSLRGRLSGPARSDRLDLPGLDGGWHDLALQVTGDGEVWLVIDGRLVWRTSWRVPRVGRVRIGLGGQNVRAEIKHGPLTVFPVARYSLPVPRD